MREGFVGEGAELKDSGRGPGGSGLEFGGKGSQGTGGRSVSPKSLMGED